MRTSTGGRIWDDLRTGTKITATLGPLRVRVNTLLSPSLFGIDYIPLGTVAGKIAYDAQSASEFGPCPGWYAVSAHYLHDPAHDYLLQFEPVATAGYSIYIYHITLEDANRAPPRDGVARIAAGVR